jgi:hypothetical protein
VEGFSFPPFLVPYDNDNRKEREDSKGKGVKIRGAFAAKISGKLNTCNI